MSDGVLLVLSTLCIVASVIVLANSLKAVDWNPAIYFAVMAVFFEAARRPKR